MSAALLLLSLLLAARAPRTPPAPDPAVALGQGQRAFAAGEYRKAARALNGLYRRAPRVRDYALYLQAESEFFAGRPAAARVLFIELSGEADSRFAELAPWRVADCLWTEGRRDEAVESYRRLLTRPPAGVDVVVARFRVAETADPAEAGPLFRQIHAEYPRHPLAEEAGRRGGPENPDSPAAEQPDSVDPRTRLQRAARLVAGRRFEDAVTELEAMPADLPEGLREERDLQLGMAKFRTRHAYPEAAALLAAVAPRLEGDRAAFATFHAARAWLRAGRTDEAIAGVRQVVDKYPGSSWAAEAQFLIGWLEFNRGAYAQALPGLQTTIDRHRRTSFGESAAWYLALSQHFLGRPEAALAAVAEYARLARADAEAGPRVAYWRGRWLLAKGNTDEGLALWRGLVKDDPFGYYALLAAARLRERRLKVKIDLPRSDFKLARPPRKVDADPALLRAEDLARAGLAVEAGLELQRSEGALEQRLGKDPALTVLLDRYPRYQGYRRALQLADSRGGSALRAVPADGAKTIWQAYYPRGYEPLVEKEARRAHVPPLFVYAIMHKESGFGPTRSSPVDARGLMQLMPSLGQEMSTRLRVSFIPEDLFRPEVNIRFGTARLGELSRQLQGQLILMAGAYNGGITAVERWVEQHGARPLDEFLELVGFRESREYMKRVTALLARYTYLYTGKPLELSLALPAPKNKPPPRRPAEPPAAADAPDEP